MIAVFLGMLAVVSLTAAPPCAAGDFEEITVTLPVSFEKVWFKPRGAAGLGKGKQAGLLTVTESGLEFTSKKTSHNLPWSRVEMLSHGPIASDPDTDWVVLTLSPVAGEYSFIGYRDGRKMGYAQDTTKIFMAVFTGLQNAGFGPFDKPEGAKVHIAPLLQYSLALPPDWNAFSLSETVVGGRPAWGRTVFSPSDLAATRGDAAARKQQLRALTEGVEPAVFLERFDAGNAVKCDRLGKNGERRVREQIDTALRPMQLQGELVWTAEPHRYCTAWTASGRATRGETTVDLSFYVVSDGFTGYLFTHPTSGDGGVGESFETITRSLKTADTR